MGRVAIFIDGGYAVRIFRSLGVYQIDYQELVERRPSKKELLRAYYYDCPRYQGKEPEDKQESERKEKQKKFFYALNRIPNFEVRLGKLQKKGETAEGKPILVQKRVDVMLAVDMVELAATEKVEEVVILSGDSDFLPAVQAAKRHGVTVLAWHGPRSTCHHELLAACDERHRITRKFVQTIEKTKPSHG